MAFDEQRNVSPTYASSIQCAESYTSRRPQAQPADFADVGYTFSRRRTRPVSGMLAHAP
jgi:hypothetical protein